MIYIICAVVFVIGTTLMIIDYYTYNTMSSSGVMTVLGITLMMLSFVVAYLTFIITGILAEEENRSEYCEQAVLDNRFNSQEECLYILKNY